MRHLAHFLVAATFLCGVARAEDAGDAEEIANWTAPPYWSAGPTSSSETHARRTASAVQTLPFVALTPCRVADTRNGFGFTGQYGPPFMPGGVSRNFTIWNRCGIPNTAQAVSFNLTVTNTAGPGFLLAFPQGGVAPNVSTLNYLAGQTIANAALVPLGTGGGVTVVPGVSGFDLIIDINGYYAPETGFVAKGGDFMTGGLQISDFSGIRALGVQGDRSGGFPAPIGAFFNASVAGNASPALYAEGTNAGTYPDGVLSVRSAGAGYIARFGTTASWLTHIDPSGNFQTSGNVNGTNGLSTQGNLGVSGKATIGTNLGFPTALSVVSTGTNHGVESVSDCAASVCSAVFATNNGNGDGVRGRALGNGIGTYGYSSSGVAIYGDTSTGKAAYLSGPVQLTTLAGSGNRAVYSDSTGILTNSSSDARLKKNVVPLGTEIDVLATLSRLRGVAFNWDTSVERAKGLGDQREIGLLAQDVEAVLPQVVGAHSDGYKSVDYPKLTALLIEVAKAQQALLEAQARSLEEIRREVGALKAGQRTGVRRAE